MNIKCANLSLSWGDPDNFLSRQNGIKVNIVHDFKAGNINFCLKITFSFQKFWIRKCELKIFFFEISEQGSVTEHYSTKYDTDFTLGYLQQLILKYYHVFTCDIFAYDLLSWGHKRQCYVFFCQSKKWHNFSSETSLGALGVHSISRGRWRHEKLQFDGVGKASTRTGPNVSRI